jgi:hypothetical protein
VGLANDVYRVAGQHRGDAIPDQNRVIHQENFDGGIAVEHASTVAGIAAKQSRWRLKAGLRQVLIEAAEA